MFSVLKTIAESEILAIEWARLSPLNYSVQKTFLMVSVLNSGGRLE